MESIVYNTDCVEWMKSYDGEPIKLVVTDCPYDIPNTDGGGGMPDKIEWMKSLESDTLTKSYDIEGYAELVEKIQDGKINAYFFCNKLQIPEYFRVYVGIYKCKFDILSWHKTNALPTFYGKYLTDTEYILYFRNKGGCNPKSYEDAKTFFLGDINLKDKQVWQHPTIKPINIVRTLIRTSSEKGDLVYDGFLGSGTTRVACFFEDRRFVGCELDKQWYDMQEKRYQEQCLNVTKHGNTEYKQLTIFD